MDPADRDQLTTTFVELAIRLGVLALLLYWSLILIRPFISIGIWSAVLTVALYPIFDWIASRLGGRRRLAAALITGLALLIVIGPATWLVLSLIDGLRMLSERLDVSNLSLPLPPESVREWPVIGKPIYEVWDMASANLTAAFIKVAPQLKPIGGAMLNIAADAGIELIKFLVSIVVAGFLFSPGPSLVSSLRVFVRRLASKRGEAFVSQAGATIRAVSRGVIGISALQAVLASLGLMAAGVPGSGLITFAVLVLGIIQIGPSVVLIPVIIWSWVTMETRDAALFTAYMVPVNLLDNVLRPLVMGRGLGAPTLVILVGLVGGVFAYGITGLFLGPIVLAVVWELLAAWLSEQEA
jgi:predicted PurR-regulated permease PerM